MPNQANSYILEASWEVCNKIGGIYTVLSTKAKTLQKQHKDHIIFLGPDIWSEAHPASDFIEMPSLLKGWREQALLPEGVTVRVGRWNIPGKPIAILVKFDALYASKDQFYAHLWEKWRVDSLHAYGDYDEACAFARACAYVIESFAEYLGKRATKIIAHFNEWTLGAGLLMTKELVPNALTVFTTHATCIGRSICGNNKPLYDYLHAYNGDQMAAELNMQSKHSLEKAAANAADCFTTVSDVTARECEQLLERRPDIVTPNGFEPGFVPAKTRFNAARQIARTRMIDVARSLTGVDFDDDTFIVATSGRCEYRNKGIDLFLDVIYRLQQYQLKRRILAFVMVPAWAGAPRADLIAAIADNNRSRLNDPVLTHQLNNYNDDPINQRIHQLGFADNQNDRMVTVIYVPCYLTGSDGIFNLPYYDLLVGMDATVFPSYYEPWGYTPLESIAFGVPTITTTLSGFGQWIKTNFANRFDADGAVAVERTDSDYDRVVDTIACELFNLSNASDNEIRQIHSAAMTTARMADWSLFIKHYDEAFRIASQNHNN